MPLTIGELAFIKHLQQNVEDIGMGFFNLIEQYHLIWPAAHRFGQAAAFFISNIARGRTNQPRYGMSFHIFGHINPQHRAFVIKQKLG